MTNLVAAAPFELELNIKGNQILNGDVPVRWCITPEYAVELEEGGITDPHILLVAVHGDEMSRRLIPLGEMKTFVRCTRAGETIIHAWVINGEPGRKSIKHRYVGKIDNDWSTSLIYDGEAVGTDQDGILKHTTLTVTIPQSAFGKEPSAWVKWYSNMWHRGKSADECEFRKRLLLAFGIKWIGFIPVTIVYILLKFVVAAVVAALGYRDVINWTKLNYFFRCYYYPLDAMFKDESRYATGFDNDFLFKKKINGKTITCFTFAPFIPCITALLGFAVYVVSTPASLGDWAIELGFVLIGAVLCCMTYDCAHVIHTKALTTDFMKKFHRWMDTPLCYQLSRAEVILITFMSIICVIGLYAYWYIGQFILIGIVTLVGVMYGMDKFLTWASLSWALDPSLNKPTNIPELMCPCEGKEITKKTIRLKFFELKNKLCRPMQL